MKNIVERLVSHLTEAQTQELGPRAQAIQVVASEFGLELDPYMVALCENPITEEELGLLPTPLMHPRDLQVPKGYEQRWGEYVAQEYVYWSLYEAARFKAYLDYTPDYPDSREYAQYLEGSYGAEIRKVMKGELEDIAS